MISVGLKELKAKLSGYVDKVRQGEEIVVTHRGQEIADADCHRSMRISADPSGIFQRWQFEKYSGPLRLRTVLCCNAALCPSRPDLSPRGLT